MAWYIHGQRIYVEKDTGWQASPRRGEIDVLDSTQTLIHCAGRPSYKRTLTFVLFSGYHANILPLADICSGIPLISDQGAEGDVYIMNLKADRIFDTSRTTPVFRITAELLKDGT